MAYASRRQLYYCSTCGAPLYAVPTEVLDWERVLCADCGAEKYGWSVEEREFERTKQRGPYHTNLERYWRNNGIVVPADARVNARRDV